jgi:hypothetical protein
MLNFLIVSKSMKFIVEYRTNGIIVVVKMEH